MTKNFNPPIPPPTPNDAPVPRYTSYPTAPHFQAGVNAETYGDWLGGIGGEDTLSLYFHVPFCAAMCWYCGCHTKVVNRTQPVADYAGLLAREIRLAADAIPADPGVVHVHWGGGTPTMLSAHGFSSLMDTARRHFRFTVDAEVAVEIDPRTLTRDMARTLARAGVTRASLGVQDFNIRVQEAINRIQPFEVTENAVTWLRQAGIEDINFDLMYGLPEQSADDVVRSIDLAHRLGPDRLALFGYAHVPWMKTHQKMIDENALPGGLERMAQIKAAEKPLGEWGYRAIGLDHFAKPGDALAIAFDKGRLRRNFQGYTTDEARTLLGFGASAIGSLAEGYVQNETALGGWSRAIRAGRFAVVRGIELSADDRLRRAVIERLMCGLEADPVAMAADFGLDETFAPELAALEPMAANGLVTVTGNRIHITAEGRPLMRTVAAVFDRYLETGAARHSRAV
jgi:oxygen-independent coproporphyrinogen-3 oxidase